MRRTRNQYHLWSFLFSWLSCSLLALGSTTASSTKVKVEFQIRNDGKVRAQVDWIDPRTKRLYTIGILEPLGYLHLNSFLEHEFQVLELPNPSSGRCQLGETVKSLETIEGCGVTTFQVTKAYSNGTSP